jgi:muconolactone delta-isomerase
MLYQVDFRIEYPASMSQKDFFSIWAREAEGALGAKKAGVVIDIWKCVGSACDRRRIFDICPRTN